MADLKGTIRLPDGDGLSTILAVKSGRLVVTAGDHEIGNWPVDKLAVRRRNNEFHFNVEGEDLVVHVEDPVALAQEMGFGMGQVEKEEGRTGKKRRRKGRRSKADKAASKPAAKAGPLSARMQKTAPNGQPAPVAPTPVPKADPYAEPVEEEPETSVPEAMPDPIEIAFDSAEEPEERVPSEPDPPVEDVPPPTEFEILPLPSAFETEEEAEPPVEEADHEELEEVESADPGFEQVEAERDEVPEMVDGGGLRPLDDLGVDDPEETEVKGLQPLDVVQPALPMPEPDVRSYVATRTEPEPWPEPKAEPEAAADVDEGKRAGRSLWQRIPTKSKTAVDVEEEKPAGPSLWERIPTKWRLAGAGLVLVVILGFIIPTLIALLLFVVGMGTLFLAVAAKSDSGTAIMPPPFFGTDMAIFGGIGLVLLAALIMVIA
jgi:hypothetical protein